MALTTEQPPQVIDMMDKPTTFRLTEIDERFVDAQRARERAGYPGKWELNQAYLDGLQWKFWDNRSQRLRDNVTLRDHGKFLNLMRSQHHIAKAKLWGSKRRLEVTPESMTADAREEAQAQATVLDNLDYVNETNLRNLTLSGMILTYGKAFIHVFWDPTATATLGIKVRDRNAPPVNVDQTDGVEYMGRVPGAGGWFDGYKGPFGEIKEELRLPHDVFVEPGTPSLEEADAFFVATVRSLSWLKRFYGQDAVRQIRPEQIRDARSIGTGKTYDAGAWNRSNKDQIDGGRMSEDARLVWHKQFWQRDDNGKWSLIEYVMSRQNPDGIVLSQSEEPVDHHGWIEVDSEKSERAFYSMPPLDDWRPCQDNINLYATQQYMSAVGSRKPLMIVTGKPTVKPSDYFTIVELETLATPQAVHVAEIPSRALEFGQLIDAWAAHLDQVSIVHDISRAQVPSGVKSGKAIGELGDQEMVGHVSRRQYIERADIEAARVALGLARIHYTEPRLIGSYGQRRGHRLILNTAIPAVSRVQISQSAVMPEGRAERLRFALEMWTSGLFDEGRGAEAKRFFSFLEASSRDLETLMPDGQQIEQVTQREHGLIIDGMAQITTENQVTDLEGVSFFYPYQDQIGHMARHLEMRDSDEFRNEWTGSQRLLLEMHIEEHNMAIQMAVMQQQAQQQGEPQQ